MSLTKACQSADPEQRPTAREALGVVEELIAARRGPRQLPQRKSVNSELPHMRASKTEREIFALWKGFNLQKMIGVVYAL